MGGGFCNIVRTSFVVCLFICSIFILLSRESDGGAILYFGRIRTRLGVSISEFSGCFVDFLPLNLLLVRSNQAEIIIVKRLIQGRNKTAL